MTFFITVVYTIFLGIYFQNLFHFERDPNTGDTSTSTQFSLNFLVNNSNLFRIILIGLIFLSDWIIFTILFPPKTPFQFSGADAILFFGYLPVVTLLGISCISALNDIEKSSQFLGWYHIVAIGIELVWIYLKCNASGTTTIRIGEIASFIVITLVYLIARILLGISLILRGRGQIKYLMYQLLFIASLIVKPVYLLFITNIEVTNKIFGG